MSSSAKRSAVRAAGRAARRAVQSDVRTQAERALVQHLQSLAALQVASTVGVFAALDGEPDLGQLVTNLWQRGQGVALPTVPEDPDDYAMEFVPWLAGDTLSAGRYNIPVPPRSNVIDPAVLLVSLTGFDACGNRIGRGAGYFDRYLADFTGLAIGVGFEVQRVDRVPVQNHDVPLPIIVTDLGVRFL